MRLWARLPPRARLSGAKVGGGQVQQELFHWKESSSWAGPRESGVGSRPSACPGRVRPGASGHCVLGLRRSDCRGPGARAWSWPLRQRLGTVAWYLLRTPGGGVEQVRPGPCSSSSLRLSCSGAPPTCGPGSAAAARKTFLAPPWGQRRAVTLESRRRPSPPALFLRPLPVMFTAHGVLLERQPVTEGSLASGMPRPAGACPGFSCPLPVTVSRRGWGGRSRLGIHPASRPFPLQVASGPGFLRPSMVSGHP